MADVKIVPEVKKLLCELADTYETRDFSSGDPSLNAVLRKARTVFAKSADDFRFGGKASRIVDTKRGVAKRFSARQSEILSIFFIR